MRYTVMHFGGPIVLESVFPYAPANGGPMPQKICFCTLCRGLFGPIDARTVTSHKTKYGLVKHFVQDDKELSTDDDYSDIESEPSSPVASSSVAWADYHKWPYTHTDEDTNSKRYISILPICIIISVAHSFARIHQTSPTLLLWNIYPV